MENREPSPLERDSGVASGSREPLSGPGDGRRTENEMHNIELEARGEFLEDHQRDRDSKGVAEGYDDRADRGQRAAGHDSRGVSGGD